MRAIVRLPTVTLAAVIALAILGLAPVANHPALAGPFPCGAPDPKHPCYENPFTEYGQEPNLCPTNPMGVCAAASAVNSFSFLKKHYPKLYGDTPIDTGTGKTPKDAVSQFANGWDKPGTPPKHFPGFYSRPTTSMAQSAQNFIDTKRDWFNTFAPGTTAMEGKWGPMVAHPRRPHETSNMWAFLAQQIKDHQDVELFIYDLDGHNGHAINLLGVSWDTGGTGRPCARGAWDCMIEYQDPNHADKAGTAPVLPTTDGKFLAFQLDGVTKEIFAGFAESPKRHPTPEPDPTWLLAVAGIVVLWSRRGLPTGPR